MRSGEPRVATLLPATGAGNQECAREWVGTTDQLRTTPATFSAPQRSTMDTSDRWFTLDNRGDPIWGQRVIAKSALEAILQGKPIKQAFDGYRTRNKEWKRRILTAKDITDALFDEQQ